LVRPRDIDPTATLDLGIEAGRLAAGVYVVRVAGEGFLESRRLVVAR